MDPRAQTMLESGGHKSSPTRQGPRAAQAHLYMYRVSGRWTDAATHVRHAQPAHKASSIVTSTVVDDNLALEDTVTPPYEWQCPFHKATDFVRSSIIKSGSPTSPTPGPSPFSVDSLVDVSTIFIYGLHVAMLQFAQKYGPVCKFANPASLNNATSWVFINSPENIQHICSTNIRNYGRRYLPDIYRLVTHEKGILGSQDAYNQRHRRLCQPPFRNPAQLERFSCVVSTKTQELVKVWMDRLALTGQPLQVEVALATQRLTLDIVGLVAFSHDFKQVEEVFRDLSLSDGAATGHVAQGGMTHNDRMLWAVNTFGEMLARIFITPMPLLKLMQRVGWWEMQQLEAAMAEMRGQMLRVIQQRRLEVQQGSPVPPDLLSTLLTACDDRGVGLTDEELWEDVHDIMGAGHETTATTTAAVLYCISVHPEVEREVVHELKTVLGGRPPTYNDLPCLAYLTQCVKETLRLYPAIPVFPREAREQDVLPTGHKINTGDVVFMSSYSLGRSPDVWGEDVLQFKPERFHPMEESGHHRYQWLPFGAGPRMCLGATFAQMSVTLMAASILQHLKLVPLDPTSLLIPVTYDITMNFNQTKGLQMAVLPRD